MRDFVGADDLSFTPEEQEAIRRAANPDPPPAAEPPPHRRAEPLTRPVHVRPPQVPLHALPQPHGRLPFVLAGGVVGAVLTLVTASMIDTVGHRGLENASRPVATVAIVRKTVHLREQPSVQARSLRVLPAGSVVTVDEQRTDGFDRVRYGNERGYAAAVYLALSDGVELTRHIETRVAALSGSARLREQGTLGAAPTAALRASAPVTVMGFEPSGWCLVWTGSRAGFLWGGLLEDHPTLPFRPRQEGTERVVIYNNQVLRP